MLTIVTVFGAHRRVLTQRGVNESQSLYRLMVLRSRHTSRAAFRSILLQSAPLIWVQNATYVRSVGIT